MFAATSFMFAQTVVFSDNFDTYTAGSHLAQSNPAWTTWSSAPGTAEDGVISSTQAASAPNSLYISGSNDQVYPFGNYTTGHYTLTFNYYVPSSGNGAYFNIQHVLLQQWALECYFNSTGDGNTNGVNQLAGINFYAGAPNSASGTYYVDDFVVTEVSAALVGQFAVTTENLNFSMAPNTTGSQNVTMNNPGTGGTDYYTVVSYNIPNPNTTSTGVADLKYYVDDPYTFVGWNGSAADVDLAIGFPSSALQQHIGKRLTEIDFFMNEALSTAKIRVYAMGNTLLHPGPGAVVYEQTFTPDSGWNYIQLTTPYLIDGSDLWFGVWFIQPEGSYLAPLDGAFANDYSCWYKRGSTWYNRFSGSSYDFNLSHGGKSDGTPITPWLSADPVSGTIAPGATTNVSVTANTAGMEVNDSYTAMLHCFSSDIDNSEETVPVTLNVIDVSVNEYNEIEVSLYPNPATDYVQIFSNQIERVEIYNMMGQRVFDNFYGDTHVIIPTSNLAPGTYAVTVTSHDTRVTKQVVIK